MMKAAQILLLAVAMVAVTDSLPLAAPSPEDVHPVIPLESVKESLPLGQVETKSSITDVKSEDVSSVAIVDIVEQKLKEAKSAEPEAAKPIEEIPSIVLPTEGEAAAKPEEPKETIVETPKEEVKKIDAPEVGSEESKPVVARSEESSPKTEEINTAEVPIPISAEKSLVTETKEAEAAVLSTEEKIASALPAAKELPHEASLIVDSIVKDQIENQQKLEEKIIDIAERVTRGGKITPEKSEGGQEQAAIVTPVEQTSIPKIVSEAVDSVSRSVEESKKELIASVDNAQSAAASEKIVEEKKVAEQESRKVEDAVSEIKEETSVKEEIKGEEKEGSLILEEGSAVTENEEKKEETELKEEKSAVAEEKPKEFPTPAAEDLPNAEQLTDNNQPKKPEPETVKSEETSQESSEESSSSEESGEEKKVSKHDEDSSQEESIEKTEPVKISTSEK